MANAEEKILRYKKYLDRYQDDKSRKREVYQILRKLDNLPVTLDHLQSTGIGKAVNSYRKYTGDIGDQAKLIVAKWKCLVPGIRTEQPSTSIQCETISETSYHSADAQHEHHAPLPSTQRVPYLESGKTQAIPSASSPIENTRLISPGSENDVGMCCDKTNCDDTCNDDQCHHLNGVQLKTNSGQGPGDIGGEREHKKERGKDKKHKYHDKEHSAKQKHSKQSKHSTKEGTIGDNSRHKIGSSHKENTVRDDKSSSPEESSSEDNKGGSYKDKKQVNHKPVSPSESTSTKHKSDLYKESKSDHKSGSNKESRSSDKSGVSKESGSVGHKKSSHKDKTTKDHKSSRHKKHRSRDSDYSKAKDSDDKLNVSKSKADSGSWNKISERCNRKDLYDQEAVDDDDDDKSVNGHENFSPPTDEKLGTFKEKLSRFSDSLKKVGSIVAGSTSSGFDTREDQLQHSPLQADRLNDELLNDVLMNDEDYGDAPSQNKPKEKRKAIICDNVSAAKRKDQASTDEPSAKKAKPNSKPEHHDKSSNSEGLSFEDMMRFDDELLRKQSKKQSKSSPHSSRSVSSHQSSKSKPSSREKAHRHDNGSTRAHSESRNSGKTNSGSSSSKQKSSRDSQKAGEVSASRGSLMDGEDSKKSHKRKENVFSVPQPPDKKMKLTDADIFAGLAETSSNNHMMSHSKAKEMNRSNNKADSSPEDDFLGKRNTRTQVYSGKRTNIHEIPKLRDACLRVLMDNIDDIEYVGNASYEVLKPILERCSSSQLYTIEEYNPQFVNKTSCLWEKLCKKEFRTEKPGEYESWRELYLRKHDEREARLKRLTTNIAVSFAKKQEPVKKTKLAFVDSVAKPPRNVLRQQKKHGTAGLIRGLDPLASLSSHRGNSRKRPF